MIKIEALEFSWAKAPPVLKIQSLSVSVGETVFLQGASGSGKSTLLNIVCGVFEVKQGSVTVFDTPFEAVSAAKRDRVRADRIGVIFQQFNLVPFLSITENVLLPARFSSSRSAKIGATERERRDKAFAVLDRLGLSAEVSAKRSAAELSVGQQQRVAAARALIGSPDLIIADEPTSALDHETRNIFIETLLAEAAGATVMFVSHDPTLSAHFDRTVDMRDINLAMKGRDNSDGGAL